MKTAPPSSLWARRIGGFTLIELMVSVAVIGILSAIAYPSYLQHVRKSRRADAKSGLMDLAARQERYFSVNNQYADTPDKLGYGETAFPVDVKSGDQVYYKLSLSVRTATTYTALATAQGSQTSDSCGNFSVTHLGVQAPTTAGCW